MFDVNEQDVNVTVDDAMYNPPPTEYSDTVFDANEQDVTVTVDESMDIPPP